MIVNRTFSTGEITKFADVTNDNLQNWLKRGVIIGHREIKGGGSVGQRRHFSWFNLMEIATAAALLKIGVSSRADAFAAAQAFSHTGSGGSSWVGDAGLSDNSRNRWPGFPYHYALGVTFMIFAAGESRIVLSADGSLTSTMLGGSLSLGCVVLNATQLFAAVAGRAGLDYRNVLDELYNGSDA